MTYYLGVDAGGSNCRCRITDADGTVVGTGAGGQANARIGLERLHDELRRVTDQAVSEAGLAGPRMSEIHAGIGLAGISRPGIRAGLGDLAFSFGSVAYESDAYIANLGANGGGEGAILIIGTGSIAHIRLTDSTFTIGGYGFPISDEGSGAALGLSAMRHALRALDGRTRKTPLSAAVTERFEHDTARAIAWMAQASPRDYGAFAPLVMDYAEAGDEIARSIVEDAALHIERFIETIFARGAPRCVLVGGLAPRIRPWLRSKTVERLSDPMGDSLDGALQLARESSYADRR